MKWGKKNFFFHIFWVHCQLTCKEIESKWAKHFQAREDRRFGFSQGKFRHGWMEGDIKLFNSPLEYRHATPSEGTRLCPKALTGEGIVPASSILEAKSWWIDSIPPPFSTPFPTTCIRPISFDLRGDWWSPLPDFILPFAIGCPWWSSWDEDFGAMVVTTAWDLDDRRSTFVECPAEGWSLPVHPFVRIFSTLVVCKET